MNPQPYQTPPKWWPSKLNPTFVRLVRMVRNRSLRQQGITDIEVQGGEKIRDLMDSNHGVLISSNHSFHYDSYVMIEAGQRSGWHAHYLTAWQVFGMASALNQWFMQQHGCFSINREGMDSKALKQSISVLTSGDSPLMIFPEGDIYHSNDLVMPFREGVGAIPLAAAKRAERSVYVVPSAMKCFYTDDPTAELISMMDRLETHLGWKPASGMSLVERIYRFGTGFLALKEVEYLGHPVDGDLPDRIRGLANAILEQVRSRNSLTKRGNDVPDQIKNVRSFLIKEIEKLLDEEVQMSIQNGERKNAIAELEQYRRDLKDMFFVTQLSSYRGDYTAANPTIERIAETIDKFEEDAFGLQAPTPRGRRRAVVQFGEPIEVIRGSQSAAELSTLLESKTQELLNGINQNQPSASLVNLSRKRTGTGSILS